MVAWLNNPMTKGILIGVGVSAVAFYAYKKNEAKVDSFMRNHGINVKTPTPDFKTMSVDDLMRTKENIDGPDRREGDAGAERDRGCRRGCRGQARGCSRGLIESLRSKRAP